jgi:translation initiation factor IF-1
VAKEDLFKLEGEISQLLPNRQFRVVFPNGHESLCYLGGRLKKIRLQFVEGDPVEVELSTYDLSKGRIIKRLV